MTRTPDSNTEKLNELYVERVQIEKEITFLNTRLGLLNETLLRTNINSVRKNREDTLSEIDKKVARYVLLQNKIDKLLDAAL